MSVEVEKSVLGCMMLDEGLAREAVDQLTPEMFAHGVTRRIFSAATDQYWAGKPLDGVTLTQVLPGDAATLLKLAEYVPTTRHGMDYIRIVRDDWQKKSIQEALTVLLGETPCHTSVEIVEQLHGLVEEQNRILAARGNMPGVSFAEAVQEFLEWLKAPKETAAQTGYRGVDQAMGGFLPGSVTVIAARSGGGKTDFALNLALNLARKEKKVLYFSMEMPRIQLMQRVASRLTHIDGTRIRDKALSAEENADAACILQVVEKSARMQFVEEARIPVSGVRRNIDLYRPDIVFIDHIGLMERPEAKESYRSLGRVSNALKQLALEKKLPVVELVQQNRMVEGRKDKRPVMADLRETGDLEQDADFVLFLWSEEELARKRLSGDAWADINVTLAKNRHGRTGDFKFHWQPQYHTFTEVETRYE